MKRLVWLDISKALAISWVVYFHFFRTVFEHYDPPPADWTGIAAGAMSILRGAWWEISGLGFHAVGVFIILSGWALMESAARRVQEGEMSWATWYRARLLRLYPMYWVAHIVYFISPFVARLEPIDSRVVLSLLGLRFINIDMNFMYLNAAWWYFSMLIQFYLIFPLLFWSARKLGPWVFLVLALALGFVVRYLMLIPYPQDGLWVLGGCAICRLPEFALGMALGIWHSRAPERVEKILLGGIGLLAGVILYPAALQLYSSGLTYVFVDFSTSACCFLVIVGVAGIIARFSSAAKLFALIGTYSYGLYLIHQPYVIWLGLNIRPQPILTFLIIFLITIAILSAWGILLERSTNTLMSTIFPARKRSTA